MGTRAIRRGKARRQHDLAVVSRLYLEAKPLPAIAAELNITTSQVSEDLRVIRRHWRMSQLRDFDEAKAREIAKIDHLESTYWDAWFRSQNDQEETVTERRDGTSAAALARVKRRTGVVGDAVFLDGVMKCIDRRIRLLGLDAPTKLSIEDVRAEASRIAAVTGFSVDEILAEAQSIVNALG